MASAWAAPERLVLLGHPVSHSLSPRFQQAALDAARLPLCYDALDTPPVELWSTLQSLRAQRAAGNVTIPHKEAIFRACDTRTELAELVGAVNTFAFDAHDALVGHNTDVHGAMAAIAAVVHAARPLEQVVVLGAGGSAAAVLAALVRLGAPQVVMLARTVERAERLAERFPLGVRVVPFDVAAQLHVLRRADLIVNATSIGLQTDDMPLAPEWLSAHTAVLDLVYRSGETPWVRDCRARGLSAEDGLRMLVEQGAASFAWWFDREPDRDAMWAALEPRPGGRA